MSEFKMFRFKSGEIVVGETVYVEIEGKKIIRMENPKFVDLKPISPTELNIDFINMLHDQEIEFSPSEVKYEITKNDDLVNLYKAKFSAIKIPTGSVKRVLLDGKGK